MDTIYSRLIIASKLILFTYSAFINYLLDVINAVPLSGLLCSVLGQSLYFKDETITVSLQECANASLHCSYGNLSDVTINLLPDFTDIATVYPSTVTGKCPRDWNIKVCAGQDVGHTILNALPDTISIKNKDAAFLHVNVNKLSILEIVSILVGWLYFLAWSISFYPQIYINYRRQCVIGLNFDFLALNLIGFVMYSLFNCGMYFVPSIQKEYLELRPRSLIPVLFNDVFFSVHAVVMVLLTIIQCWRYDSGEQCVSLVARGIMFFYGAVLFTTGTLASINMISWCNFLYGCSYIKLSITFIKYIPQAYLNYTRKSTEGWSIANIFLDFTGGALSVLQMIMNGYNYNDWESIFGDFTKFGLGLFSIFFDLFFMWQHYILYGDKVLELRGV